MQRQGQVASRDRICSHDGLMRINAAQKTMQHDMRSEQHVVAIGLSRRRDVGPSPTLQEGLREGSRSSVASCAKNCAAPQRHVAGEALRHERAVDKLMATYAVRHRADVEAAICAMAANHQHIRHWLCSNELAEMIRRGDETQVYVVA